MYNLLPEIMHMTPPNSKRTESALNVHGKRKNWNYLSNSMNDKYLSKFKLFQFWLDYLWHYFSRLYFHFNCHFYIYALNDIMLGLLQ